MPGLNSPSDYDELSSPAATDDESPLTMGPTDSIHSPQGLFARSMKHSLPSNGDKSRKRRSHRKPDSEANPKTESEPELSDEDADEIAATIQHDFGSSRLRSRSAEADCQDIKDEVADDEDADNEDTDDEGKEQKGKDYERNEHENLHQYPRYTVQQVQLRDGMKLPLGVTELASVGELDIPENGLSYFTLDFLMTALNVRYYENGWYKKATKKELDEIPVPSCMIIEGDHEPLLPQFPGSHGARISAFIMSHQSQMELEKYRTTVPLFIRRGNQGYRYYGTYREPRAPDRIGANEVRQDVPYHIKAYWATKMGRYRKPQWAIEAIREAWPKKTAGWVDDDNSLIEYDESLEESLGAPLKANISRLEAEKVTANEIMNAFDNSDMSGQPAMRLFYEYLQCDGYDRAFYETLVARQNRHPNEARRH